MFAPQRLGALANQLTLSEAHPLIKKKPTNRQEAYCTDSSKRLTWLNSSSFGSLTNGSLMKQVVPLSSTPLERMASLLEKMRASGPGRPEQCHISVALKIRSGCHQAAESDLASLHQHPTVKPLVQSFTTATGALPVGLRRRGYSDAVECCRSLP